VRSFSLFCLPVPLPFRLREIRLGSSRKDRSLRRGTKAKRVCSPRSGSGLFFIPLSQTSSAPAFLSTQVRPFSPCSAAKAFVPFSLLCSFAFFLREPQEHMVSTGERCSSRRFSLANTWRHFSFRTSLPGPHLLFSRSFSLRKRRRSCLWSRFNVSRATLGSSTHPTRHGFPSPPLLKFLAESSYIWRA